MKRLLLVVFAFAAGFAAHTFADTQRPQVSARTILESDVKGGVLEQAVVQVYQFPPAAALPWHIHPDAHEVAYILDGALTLEIDGQGSRVLKAGEAVHVQPNQIHRGLADPVQGVKLVAVRFKPKNQPLVTLINR